MSKRSNNIDPIPYLEAVKRYREFMQDTDMKAYTFDPVMCKGFNVDRRDHAREMHALYCNGSDPLYIIAVTNHMGPPDDEIESAYNKICNSGFLPFFGRWFDMENSEYTDVGYFLNYGIDESKITELKQLYSQQSVLMINSDGSIEYI